MEKYVDLSLCFLILSGSFALISLGILFLKSTSVIDEIKVTLKVAQETMDRANKTLDDINTKLEMLNTPIAVISGFFNKDRTSFSILSGIMGAKAILKRKSKRR